MFSEPKKNYAGVRSSGYGKPTNTSFDNSNRKSYTAKAFRDSLAKKTKMAAAGLADAQQRPNSNSPGKPRFHRKTFSGTLPEMAASVLRERSKSPISSNGDHSHGRSATSDHAGHRDTSAPR